MTFTNAMQKAPLKRLYVGLLIGALIAGSWFRLVNLGERQLAEDEYFFVRSVEFILEKGVSEFPDGGYYLRSLPLQYITAANVLLFGESNFAYRLPATLFSFLALGVAYILFSRYLNRIESLTLVAILSLSSWNIEFSRFIRMYSFFQFTTLCFLLSLPLIDKEKGSKSYIPHFLYIINALAHQLAIALLPVLILRETARYFESRAHSWKRWTATLFTALSGITILLLPKILNRASISENVDTTQLETHRLLTTPVFPFFGTPEPSNISFYLIIVFAVISVAIAYYGKWKTNDKTRLALFSILLVFTIYHQFSAAFLTGFILVFWKKAYRTHELASPEKLIALLVCLTTVAWTVIATINIDTLLSIGNGSFLKGIRLAFVHWPDLFYRNLMPWVNNLPILTLIFLISTVAIAAKDMHKDLPSFCRSLSLPAIFHTLLLGLLTSELSSTRYGYHLYPLLFLTSTLILKYLLTKFSLPKLVTAPGLLVLAFLFSNDFVPRHLADVTSFDASHRTGEFSKFRRHWYPRYDVKSTAEFANSQIPESESVIVSWQESAIFYYLERDYSIYFPINNTAYLRISRGGKQKHIWAGVPILSTERELQEFSKSSRHIWIIRPSGLNKNRADAYIEQAWGNRAIKHDIKYTSPDQVFEISRIELAEL